MNEKFSNFNLTPESKRLIGEYNILSCPLKYSFKASSLGGTNHIIAHDPNMELIHNRLVIILTPRPSTWQEASRHESHRSVIYHSSRVLPPCDVKMLTLSKRKISLLTSPYCELRLKFEKKLLTGYQRIKQRVRDILIGHYDYLSSS